MILGKTIQGTQRVTVTGQVVGLLATMPATGDHATKLTALLDGLGAGSGTQAVRAGLWTPSGTLVAVTEPVEIEHGLKATWVDFVFAKPVSWAAGTQLLMALHFGAGTTIRWNGKTSDTTGKAATHAYEVGETNLTGITTGPQPTLFATYNYPAPWPTEEDPWYARLGFGSAQETLGDTGPDKSSRVSVKAGWHGTQLDPEPQGASFAIVDPAGPLADFVGERVKVTCERRSIYAYIHRAADLEGEVDISLSRRLYAALGSLSAERLGVRVEALI